MANEIDIGMLKDNRLYIIECKTRRFTGQKNNGEGSEVLYKLDSLRDLIGGLQARAMLVSFNEIKNHDRNRAKELHINLCCYTDIRNLDEKLTTWLLN